MKHSYLRYSLGLTLVSGLLLLSGCTNDKTPEIIEAKPISNQETVQETSDLDSETEVQEPVLPNLSTTSYLDEDVYMTINTIYEYIESYENDQVKNAINQTIDKNIVDVHNNFYTNLRISKSQAGEGAVEGNADENMSGDTSAPEELVSVNLSIEGTVIYLDDQIISYMIKGVTDDVNLSESQTYLNFDLKTGQVIPIFDLVSQSELLEAFQASYDQSYQTPMNANIFGYWTIDNAYGFIDPETITVTAPAYYLSYEQTTPMTIRVSLSKPYDLDLNTLGYIVGTTSSTEYTEAYNLDYLYPEIVSTDPLAVQINADIKSRVDSALEYNLAFSKEDYQNSLSGEFEWRPYYFNCDYEVYTNTEDYLSFGITFYQYTGGAHGLVTTSYFNYDLNAEAPLTLAGLFEPDFDFTTYINDIIYRAIDDMDADGEGYLFEGVTESQKFYIKGNWIFITFDPYDIAPYAAGTPEFKVPLPSN